MNQPAPQGKCEHANDVSETFEDDRTGTPYRVCYECGTYLVDE